MFICLKAIFQSLPSTTTPHLLLLDQNLSDVSLSQDTNGIDQAFQWGLQALKKLSSWDAPVAVSCWRSRSSWNPTLLRALTSINLDVCDPQTVQMLVDEWWGVTVHYFRYVKPKKWKDFVDCTNILVVHSKPNYWRTFHTLQGSMYGKCMSIFTYICLILMVLM